MLKTLPIRGFPKVKKARLSVNENNLRLLVVNVFTLLDNFGDCLATPLVYE